MSPHPSGTGTHKYGDGLVANNVITAASAVMMMWRAITPNSKNHPSTQQHQKTTTIAFHSSFAATLTASWQHQSHNVHIFGVMEPPIRRSTAPPQRLVLSSSSSSSDNNAAAPAVVPIIGQVTQQMKVSMKANDTMTLATIRSKGFCQCWYIIELQKCRN
jgi:hypothetical protein